jgi:hypothetical protein
MSFNPDVINIQSQLFNSKNTSITSAISKNNTPKNFSSLPYHSFYKQESFDQRRHD